MTYINNPKEPALWPECVNWYGFGFLIYRKKEINVAIVKWESSNCTTKQ